MSIDVLALSRYACASMSPHWHKHSYLSARSWTSKHAYVCVIICVVCDMILAEIDRERGREKEGDTCNVDHTIEQDSRQSTLARADLRRRSVTRYVSLSLSLSLSIYIYIYTYIYIYVEREREIVSLYAYMYIYIYIERERDMCIYIYIYIYIHIYIYI